MRLTTLFLPAENIHLIKDVGMIPFYMHKKHGYESTLACYKNGDYSYLDQYTKGLKLDFVRKSGSILFDAARYLLHKSSQIDILQLFHLRFRNYVWIFIYKLLNHKGKIYLKLDASVDIKKIKFRKHNILDQIKLMILRKCSLISVETSGLYQHIKENWPINIELIPNGFDDESGQLTLEIPKEDTILTVGRIGSYEKANEILLEAFALAADSIPKWKLKLIGPIEQNFHEYINKYLNRNATFAERIDFVGPIYDRQKLLEEYSKAKIYCLTSRFESFGLALLEAMSCGCFIITSNVESAIDLTNNGTLGDIFDVNDPVELSKILINRCLDEVHLHEKSLMSFDYACANFTWTLIVEKIHRHLIGL